MKKGLGIIFAVFVLICFIFPPLGLVILFAFSEVWFDITKPQGPLVKNELEQYQNTKCAREEINSSADCYFLNKARTKVYFEPGFHESWGPAESYRVSGADTATFRHVGDLAFDKNNVYYEDAIIPYLSPTGFRQLTGGYILGKNKSGIGDVAFYIREFHIEPIKHMEGVDVASFNVGDIYAEDKNYIYLRGEIVSSRENDFQRLDND